MVFCYKIITESPRRSRCVSPRKASPRRISYIPSTTSDLVGTLDYDAADASSSDVFDSIPERDIKLLQALARKREENQEREKLAEYFQKMWLKEKEERELMEAETSEQYKRYLHEKRAQERSMNEYRTFQKMAEQQARRGQLLDCIRYKEQRSADLKAWKEDKKISKLIDKAMEEEARIQLAMERRCRLDAADTLRRRIELLHAQRKEDDARQRRCAILRDASKRVAISNALSSWETSLQRHELAAQDAARRAMFATQHAMKRARSGRVTRAMDRRRARARRIAAVTELMRDVVRSQ
ncbi:stress response protein nst1-like [Zerene cesonia]|uniref:stress response protein nst1-like n=1 Tax=Zerene cesonia TaxID=33412 RepID=UPI0018E50BAC|nr:stress response protein nst1-like [Zerene cesonia]